MSNEYMNNKWFYICITIITLGFTTCTALEQIREHEVRMFKMNQEVEE